MEFRRLISSPRSEISRMRAADLKHAIRLSEGRTILCQVHVAFPSIVDGASNIEVCQAYGADMIFLNGYSMDENDELPGLLVEDYSDGELVRKQYRIKDFRKLIDVPIGVYFECRLTPSSPTAAVNPQMAAVRKNRVANAENLKKLKEEGVDFVVLAGNPNSGTKTEEVIDAVKRAKEVLGDDVLIFAGKWEDGVYDKVLGDPLAARPAKDVIKDLIDAGADVICLPMPGSRQGITVDMIRECVEFVHSYKEGTLAMTFLDGSVEGADEATIRDCTLMSKMTGADIHTIGDAGISGCPIPENIHQMSITTKGRRLTWRRIAGSRR